MLWFVGAMLLPPQVFADEHLRSCSSPQSFIVEAPHLRVNASTSGDALSLHIALLSTVSTSASRSPTAFHAFVRVDDNTILLNLPRGGYVSLTYPGLARGIHRVRYGVYRDSSLWNGAIICPRI
ncbi:MAG: hypothetical protein M3N13_01485 [Candidatus Eremiobacteraeota bacterium]|nr:hypothetical protein [Candidatus Eremiobacteraeota bacterium]